ncbi:MAG TPA: RHS repeat-associated core domain-containing protein, partial [Catenuloplanes sp.]
MAFGLAAALLSAGLVVPPSAAQAAPFAAPAVKPLRSVPVRPVVAKPKPQLEVDKRAERATPKVGWPRVGTVEVDLPAAAPPAAASKAGADSARRVAPAKPALAKAGSLPVWVGAAAPSAAAAASDVPPKRAAAVKEAPRRVRVEVLDRAASRGVGVDGPVLRLARADGQQGTGRVTVELDYSGFRDAFGAGWDSRLALVSLPDCALSTPHLPECRGSALRSTNARAEGRLSAELPVAAAAGQRAASPTVQAAGSGQLVGVTSKPSSVGGNFTATPLSPSATWGAGGSTGDFSWSYPITVPPSPGSASPQISLGYSSSNVDGRTSATNNQVSWIGTGFDFWPGFVERTFKGCSSDGNQTGDLCWQDEFGSATISLNGKASEVVRDDRSGIWRLKDDDGSKVEQLAGAVNGADGGEHWRVTTQEGTQYYFGLNRLNRSTDAKRDTNSAWTVPVAGNHAKERCHGKTFAESFCNQAWRMNLDHVIDVHGNTVTYYYQKETNSYGRNNGETTVAYTRGGWLDHVDYGQRTGQEHTTLAPARVRFETATRCADGAVCDPARPETLLDTPLDLACDKAKCDEDPSATFWTTKRLKKITTEVRDGAGYRPVDSWTLRHTFPARWDKTKPSMWLAGITRTGLSGPAPVTLPEVVFDGQELTNRVGVGTFAEPMVWWRMKTVYNEYGGGLTVTYSEPDCSPTDVPKPESNNRRCYPTYWKPDHYPEVVLDWFRKYVVTTVTAFDRVAEAATTTTEYRYPNPPAWHYDDYDGISDRDHRTWSQWRGYDVVETVVGTGKDGPQTSSETLYMRGMDGDRTANGGTRPAKVTDADNVEIVDKPVLQGFVRQQITRKGVGGPVLSRTVNDPWVSEPTAVAKHPWGPTEARIVDTGSVRSFTALSTGGWRKVQVDKTFDKFGVVTQIDDVGDVDTAEDDRCTRLHYPTPGAARWMAKVPYRSETVTVRCATTPSRPDDVASDVHTYYDGSDQLGATPTRGIPTRVDELVEYQGGKPRYVTKSRVVHDDLGRVQDSWDANGKKTHTSYTQAPGSGTISVTVTNPLNHTTTTQMETARGLPLVQVDANNRRTEMAYDALGRLIKGWLPGRAGKPGTSPNAEFVYQVLADKPVAVQTRALNAQGGYISTFEILDGLLRPRQKQIPAPGGGRVLTDTFFDSRGLTIKTNAGYFNKDAGPGVELRKVTTDVEVPGQTITEYDGAAQPTAQIFRSAGIDKWRTTLQYGGDRVHATPPAGGTATTTISDGRGRTTELHQYHGATPTGDKDITKYRYDRRGNLAEVIDPAGNTWGYKHDLAGRLIESHDPDKGTSVLSYNDAGQLLTSTDALKNTLAYVYDDLGRQTELRDGTPTGALRTKTVYDTLPGGVGLPTSATRYSNQSEYTTGVTEYDKETGRPKGQFVSIPLSEGGLANTYTYPVTYYNDGSLRTLSMRSAGELPDEILTYGYNELNLPTKLSGRMEYVSETAYTKLSEPERYLLGAGPAAGSGAVSLNYYYQDATRRLEQTIVTRSTAPMQVANTKYDYDPAGNITKIADTPNSRLPDVQCFTYDHLRRLTEAWTPTSGACDEKQRSADALGGAAPYWQSYKYDVTGNRTELTNHTKTADLTKKYTYPAPKQPRPHALASVTTTSTGTAGATGTTSAAADNVERFEYDDAGNTKTRTTGGSTQVLDWDAEGHLTNTVEGDKKTSYIYDAAGNRLLRRDPTGTTLYLPSQELKADTAGQNVIGTRYYSHNGATIASRVGEGDITWLAGDHQGTGQIAIEQFRQTITRRYQTPFGEARGPQPAWPNEKGFVGGTVDAATRLTHIGAREYDAPHGRFISVDPIIDPLDPQQMNGYAYSNNSPITFADPDGLAHIDCVQRAGTVCHNGVPTGADKPKSGGTGSGGTGAGPPAPPPEHVERAKEISKRTVMDVVIDIGGEVLKEVLGVNDFVDCFTKGSVMGCINTALNVIPWGQFAKIGKIGKAIKRVWEAVTTFKREL